MKIAFDFDNTIVNYQDLWQKASKLEKIIEEVESKEEVKRIVKNKYNWPSDWIKVQGRLYGELINEVKLDKDLINLLEYLKKNKHSIHIVSHKTQRSLCDRYDLRDVAIKYIDKNHLHQYFSKINFFETIQDKVDHINNTDYDFVIDDLEKIGEKLSRSNFIHFSNSPSKNYISLHNWERIESLICSLSLITPFSYEKVGKHSFKVTSDKEINFLKVYLDNDRFEKENILLSHLYPEIIKYKENSIILTKKIDSQPVIKLDSSHSHKLISAFRKLKNIKFSSNASHSIESFQCMYNHIQIRMNNIEDKEHLSKITKVRDYIFSNIDKDIVLKKMLTNPDLFKGNLIHTQDEIIIMDLESFGYDDPARTLLNFIHHPGHNYSNDELDIVIDAMSQAYNDDELKTRAIDLMNYSALEWLLIIGNHVHDNLSIFNDYLDTMYEQVMNKNKVISWKNNIYDYLKK